MNYEFSIKIAKPKRGMTLIELLVAFTLSVLLLGLMFKFLIPALKISSRTTQRAESQQRATLALRNIVSEIEQTNLFGVSFLPDSTVIAVHPIVEVSQNSQRIYADHVVVYQYDQARGVIERSEWRDGADPGIDSARKLSVDELMAVESFLQRKRIVARDVEEFSLRHSGVDDLVRLPLVARLKMREQGQSGARSFELNRTISLRTQQ